MQRPEANPARRSRHFDGSTLVPDRYRIMLN
jgi:hypothetical protein